MKFKALFQPIKIGRMEVRNRLVVPPMGTNYANEDSSVSQRLINYHAENAKGGFGLITIEVTAVAPGGKAIIREPGLWSDEQIAGYAKLAEAIHRHGAKMSVQLHHAGRQTVSALINGEQPVSASPLPCPYCREVPRALDTGETYEMIENFVAAAERAKKAGADAVEVHGAHGYLIAQYMSAYSNRRTDEFGGSFENRLRFPRLIVEGIKERLGNDFPVIFRISGEEKTVGGRNIVETRAIARYLEDVGVDAMHVASGVYGSLEWVWGAGDAPLGYMADFAEEVKGTVSIPVITVGRINDPHIAEELVASGRADMVSIGRQSIADPHFPNKIMYGHEDEIVPCIACHQGCTEQMLLGNGIACTVNPFAGREGEWKIEPARKVKKVMVVGAGPAGLEAAWIMAKRGHRVAVYDTDAEAGGSFRIAALPPGKGDLAKPIAHYYHMGRKHGVEYMLGTEVTGQLIKDEKPDAIILSTGSRPLLPGIDGIRNPGFVRANDVLAGKASVGGKALIAGGGMIGSETAEFLCEYGKEVTIVEMRPEIAADMNEMVKITFMRRLRAHGVKAVTGAKITRFLDNGVEYERDGQSRVLDGFDTVILSLGTVAHNPLEETARELVGEVHVIGDARKAGKVLKAIHEAAEVAIGI